jgi:16S rRNA G966 N2-methylase RsmD
MIITTAGRANKHTIDVALELSKRTLNPYVSRNKLSIQQLQEKHNEDILVVENERLLLHIKSVNVPIFFHPNSAMFRIKRLMNEEKDPLIEAAQLNDSMSFLDCTLGLGSDSIVASFVAGTQGKVVGVESNPHIAFIVKQGFNRYKSGVTKMDDAMRRIIVEQLDHYSYLSTLPSSSFDVIYFDPMFDQNIEQSDGIRGLKQVVSPKSLSEEVIIEAKRVAKKRIVLKDHWQSERFEKFGFKVLRRKSAKFHFGVIEIE